MYTKIQFGIDLKKRVSVRENILNIANWAHFLYSEDVDPELDDLLLTLATMECGPEFEFSYEELHKIADDSIAGKDVHI